MNIRSIARKPFFDLFFLEPSMPQFLRLAYNDCFLYDPNTQKGGPRAAILSSKYKNSKQNVGLNSFGRKVKEFKGIKGNHITAELSLADLIQIGGAAAIEYCGGPTIEIGVGREDCNNENEMVEDKYLPRVDMSAEEIRNLYYPLGFANHEIVALFGNRTLGFLKNKDFEKEERWSRNPYIFDNNYYQELLDNNSPYLKTQSDLAIVNDKDFVKWVEVFANDQNLFFEHYAASYRKMSELGYNNLQYEL